jgi:hypothetical protein
MNARTGPALFALAALFAGCEAARDAPKAAPRAAARVAPGVARNTWTDEQFENWVFRNQGSAAKLRTTLNAQLMLVVEEIDRACQLTDAQKAKLRLAGRGDVKRVFDRFERARDKFRALGNDAARLQDVAPDVTRVQFAVNGGVISEHTLLMKSLAHTLTPEQLARYEAVTRQRRAIRHRANVLHVVAGLEQVVPLVEARRQKLIDVLMKETRPLRMASQYEYYLVLIQVARLPEAKLKPLFSEPQWHLLSQQLRQALELEQYFKQQGLLDDDRDAAEQPAGR